jgi:hypothetical protein
VKQALAALVGLLGRRTLPSELATSAEVLAQSAWPEMVACWSRLTPTGFPVEVTLSTADMMLRWVSEVAGPEVAESQRIALVGQRLARAEQPLPARNLEALVSLQRDHRLEYGAWIGGRSVEGGASRLKLYAEIPEGARVAALPMPAALHALYSLAPVGTIPVMLGIEPARQRTEIYLRTPVGKVDDLRPVLRAAGYGDALRTLHLGLPDGLSRLAGRRLGLSFAVTKDPGIEAAIFVSAGSMFPAAPERLPALVPALAVLPRGVARATCVTIGLGRGTLAFAVGLSLGRPCARFGTLETHPRHPNS